MNVHLGSALDEFVAGLLKSGYYQTQSEVLREGLRLLKEREEIKRLRLAELRKEIALGGEQADRGEFVDGKTRETRIVKRWRVPALHRNHAAGEITAGRQRGERATRAVAERAMSERIDKVTAAIPYRGLRGIGDEILWPIIEHAP